MTANPAAKIHLPFAFLPERIDQGKTRERASCIDDLLTTGCVPSAIELRLDIDPRIHICKIDPAAGQSVLHKAALKADLAVLKVFAEKNQINDIPDGNGDTPLMLLLNRYLERENRPELRELIRALIQRGARLDHFNNQNVSALMQILCSENEILFHYCLEINAPWTHTYIALCSDDEEIHPVLVERLRMVLDRSGLGQAMITELLRKDFSSNPVGFCSLLRELVKGCSYNPPWLDVLKKDQNEASLFCKLEILKPNFAEPLKKHFFGLGYDKVEEYAMLHSWFVPTDRPQKTNSWSYSASATTSRPPIRTRRRSTPEGDSLASIRQMLDGNDIQKRLAMNQLKHKIPGYVVSSDSKEIAIVQDVLKRNPKLINQKYQTFLLIQTIRGRCAEMTSFLIENGAEPNVYDDEYNTPLHHVLLAEAERRDPDTPTILRMLIEKGADINAMNKDAKSPLNLLFEIGRLELFVPFFGCSVDWKPLIEKKIAEGAPKNENEKKYLLRFLQEQIVSPKVMLGLLLTRTFELKNPFPQQLLREVLALCEKVECSEFQALSNDSKDVSLREKIRVFKFFPAFYLEILNHLFQNPNGSTQLLSCMLEEKDPDLVPDYDLLFNDENKRSRRNKIQMLLDLKLIESERKAEYLATKREIACGEAFTAGLVSLLPASVDWVNELREFGKGRQSLSCLQSACLKKAIPKDGVVLREVIGMLLQQDMCRSDPLIASPFETMLELVIPECKIVGQEWIEYLANDKNPISYQRKLDICSRHSKMYDWLKHQLKLRKQLTTSPPKLEKSVSFSSHHISRSSSSSGSSRSQPGSGSSTPRGSTREKKHH